jgi:hypothetical protein
MARGLPVLNQINNLRPNLFKRQSASPSCACAAVREPAAESTAGKRSLFAPM